jgi:hypothetical protein
MLSAGCVAGRNCRVLSSTPLEDRAPTVGERSKLYDAGDGERAAKGLRPVERLSSSLHGPKTLYLYGLMGLGRP